MKRAQVRELKQAVSAHQDLAAMSALLQRSVKFHHKRLALQRCLQAEKMGAAIDAATLAYCQRVADTMTPEALHDIVRKAAN